MSNVNLSAYGIGAQAGLALPGAGAALFAGSYLLDRIGAQAEIRQEALQQSLRVSTGGITPGQLVYGKAWVRGQIPYANSKAATSALRSILQVKLLPDNLDRQIFVVLALAAHECHAFHRVMIDNLTVDPGTWGDGRSFFYNTEGYPSAGPYAKTDDAAPLQCLQHLGVPGQLPSGDLVHNFSEWTPAHRGEGVAYAVFVLSRYRRKRVDVWLNRGLPDDFAVEVSGRKVYDPRLDSSPGANPTNPSYIRWSDNPALCAADYCTHPLGWNRPASHIVWSSVVEWANHCDEVVPTPANAKRFICNGVLYTKGQTHRQNLDRILNAGMGTSVFSEGKIKFVPFKQKTAIAGGDIIGDDNIKRISRETEYTGVRVRYGGDGALPTPHEVLVRTTGGDPANDIELDLGMVDQAWRAQRTAYGYLKLGEAALTLEVEGGNPLKRLVSGDVLTLESDRWGIASQRWRVDGMGWRTEDGTRATLREDDADIYTDPGSSFYEAAAEEGTVEPVALEDVPTPTGLTLTEVTEPGPGGYIAALYLQVSWTQPFQPVGTLVRYRVSYDGEPLSLLADREWEYDGIHPHETTRARIDGTPGASYDVEIAHVTRAAVLSEWVG